MAEKLSYCGELVKQQDPDRFLLSMFVPAAEREDLWALFAFNHEIAKTREVVSETRLGLIRLQWWRDAIAKIYDEGEALEHEVLKPLAAAIRNHNLPRKAFEDLIYAREFDLEDVLPSSLEGLLIYIDHTVTPLMRLAVQIEGGDPETEAVQPVAINSGLIGLMRAVPFHARQRRCYLPEEALKRHGVRLNELYNLRPQKQALSAVLQDISGEFVAGVRPESRFLKGSQTLSALYLKQLKNCQYDAFHPRMTLPPAFKALRLTLSAFMV